MDVPEMALDMFGFVLEPDAVSIPISGSVKVIVGRSLESFPSLHLAGCVTQNKLVILKCHMTSLCNLAYRATSAFLACVQLLYLYS